MTVRTAHSTRTPSSPAMAGRRTMWCSICARRFPVDDSWDGTCPTCGIICETVKCRRCGYEWVPRKRDPKLCPSCKTSLWDTEYRRDPVTMRWLDGYGPQKGVLYKGAAQRREQARQAEAQRTQRTQPGTEEDSP